MCIVDDITQTYGLIFRPYQEKYLNYSNIYGEFCITVTFVLSGVFLLDLNDTTRSYLMWSAIGVVYSMMLVNCIVTCIIMAKQLNKLMLKWRQRRQGKTL
jgi:ABC-type transport system involved in cytochrome c biogenesis permease subunit